MNIDLSRKEIMYIDALLKEHNELIHMLLSNKADFVGKFEKSTMNIELCRKFDELKEKSGRPEYLFRGYKKKHDVSSDNQNNNDKFKRQCLANSLNLLTKFEFGRTLEKGDFEAAGAMINKYSDKFSEKEVELLKTLLK